MELVKSPKKLVDIDDIQAERMREVQLLLQNLTNREETTIKLILDRIYDVGSANLVDKKFPSHTLNSTMKLIARMSKPVFRVLAWYWFKKNSSLLITNWLYSKVSFDNPINRLPNQSINVNAVSLIDSTPTDNFVQEINYLRRQVKLVTGLFVLTFSTLVIVVVGINPLPEMHLQSRQQAQSLLPQSFESQII
jgi:hypothetical protein